MPDVHTHYKVELEIVLQKVTNIHEKWHFFYLPLKVWILLDDDHLFSTKR